MRSFVTLAACALSLVTPGYGQLPDGRLLWSMDSVYVMVAVDDHAGVASRRGLKNQVQHSLSEAGLVVTDAAVPGLVVQATVRRAPATGDQEPALVMLLTLALTDNVTRVKYVDAALTRCMSAEGCRRNVEGARALGNRGIVWQGAWLGSAPTAEAAAALVKDELDDLVSAFLTAHAGANRR
jgi:hypothetical protein